MPHNPRPRKFKPKARRSGVRGYHHRPDSDDAAYAPTPPMQTGRPGPPTSDRARDAALDYLAQQAARWPRLDLAPMEVEDVDSRDAALAHAIVDVVNRRWLTLRYLLQLKVTQPFDALEAPLKAALLAGTAQILLLDRIPAYAAIDHAVEWCKHRVRRGAGGLCNAVLRRMAELSVDATGPERGGGSEGDGGEERAGEGEAGEGGDQAGPAAPARRPKWRQERDELPMSDGTALPLKFAVMPEEPLERYAAATGHPPMLLEAWRDAFGPEQARAIALHSLASAPTILRFAGGSQPAGLPLDPGMLVKHERPGFWVYNGPRETLVALLDTRDDVWAQDPASSLAVESVKDLRPSLILDICAGRGTKTRQLAATFPQARIVATDVDERRLRILSAVFKGHPRVKVTTRDNLLEYIGMADLVVLDVPCSNTGVLARRPEAKYRFNKPALEELAGLQRQIIADAIPYLREKGPGSQAGGVILYSTCSLDPSENEAHAAWAAQWHRFIASRERLTLPSGGPGQPPERYTDGSYSVVLGRSKL